jgi:hypothetical protein
LVSLEADISNRVHNVPGNHIPAQTEVTQYCSFPNDVNFDVVKRGRTTNWTKGKLTLIPSVIRLQNRLPELEIPTNVEVLFKDKWGNEAVQVHSIIGSKKDPQFIQPGDSGSFVLLDSPTNIPGTSVIGLGFAGNHASLASYMIPMDLVVEDIERVTGGRVVEPRNMGIAVPAQNTSQDRIGAARP